jgi:hypothetical protein
MPKYPTVNIVDPTKESVMVDKNLLVDVTNPGGDHPAQPLTVEARSRGEFGHRAYWLHQDYDWVLGKDALGEMILVPLKKG